MAYILLASDQALYGLDLYETDADKRGILQARGKEVGRDKSLHSSTCPKSGWFFAASRDDYLRL